MENGEMPSHGFQVSIGSLMSTALYEEMLKEDFSNLDVEKCVEAWPSLEEQKKEAQEMFRDTDFPTIGDTEITAKYIGKDELRKQLTTLKENWPHIRKRLQDQLIPYTEAKARLKAVGAPVEPEEIGISHERLLESVKRAQKIRRRFTILDIAVRANLLDKWLTSLSSR